MQSKELNIYKQIKKLNKNQNVNKHKDYSILKSMIDKKVEIETDDLVFGLERKGILRDFDETWLILEVENKREKSLIYMRLKNIESLSEVNE